MTSQVNPNNIDGTYPVAGQDNDSQGFRDNFTNIRNNLVYVKAEVEDLQNKAVLKSALTNTVLDNDFSGNTISSPSLSAWRENYNNIGSASGSVTVNFTNGNFQKITMSGSTTLAFSFPTNTSNQYASIKLWVNNTNAGYTLTLPTICTLGDPDSIAGLAGTNPPVITFSAAEIANNTDYLFEFFTVDGGTTIGIKDLIRNRDIDLSGMSITGNLTLDGLTVSTYDSTIASNVSLGSAINATTGSNVVVRSNVGSTSTTTGALVVVGGVGIAGNSTIAGNVFLGSAINATTGSNVVVRSNIASTSTTTGALVVAGGVGIAGNSTIAGNVFLGSAIDATTGSNVVVRSNVGSTSTTTGALVVAGGVGIAGNSTIAGNVFLGSAIDATTGSNVVVRSNVGSTSTTTGALVVAGGVGVAGNIFVNGNLIINSGIINPDYFLANVVTGQNLFANVNYNRFIANASPTGTVANLFITLPNSVEDGRQLDFTTMTAITSCFVSNMTPGVTSVYGLANTWANSASITSSVSIKLMYSAAVGRWFNV